MENYALDLFGIILKNNSFKTKVFKLCDTESELRNWKAIENRKRQI